MRALLRHFIFNAAFPLLVFGLFQNVSAADEGSNEFLAIQKVAASKTWKRLLHYDTRWLGMLKTESRVDRPSFFLSAEGVEDPEAELVATLKAFRGQSESLYGKDKKMPAKCAYPGRYDYLKKFFQIPSDLTPCPELDKFLKDVSAQTISYVFSSAYPNNPGSMFGHTFLHFSSKKRKDLLDQSISYAAFIGGDSGVIYMARGLFGGYPGAFSLTPLYQKVQEYNRSESRDLWEYELNYSPEEIEFILKHLWELETNASFQYFFFDENCAEILLKILELPREDLDLTHFWYYVIPPESVKELTRVSELVKQVRYRPALRSLIFTAYENLGIDKQKEFIRLIRTPAEDLSKISTDVLDAGLLYHQYHKSLNSPRAKAIAQTRSERGIVAASVSSFATQNPSAKALQSRPDLSHGSEKIWIQSGSAGSQWTTDLGFRFAFHDLLDRDNGFVPFSEIIFPAVELRYLRDRRKLQVENFTIASVQSFDPWTFLEKSLSWRLGVGYRHPKDFGCVDCGAAYSVGSVGGSWKLLQDKLMTFALATGRAEAGDLNRRLARVTPGAELGSMVRLPFAGSQLRWLQRGGIFADYLSPNVGQFFVEWTHTFQFDLTSNLALKGQIQWVVPQRQTSRPIYREYLGGFQLFL